MSSVQGNNVLGGLAGVDFRCPIQIEETSSVAQQVLPPGVSESMLAVLKAFRVAPELLGCMSERVALEYCKTLAALASDMRRDSERIVAEVESTEASSVTPSTSSTSSKRRRRAVARIVKLRLGVGIPDAQCYLRLIKLAHRDAALARLGSSPTLLALLSCPAPWFITEQDMADFSMVTLGKAYFVSVGQEGSPCYEVLLSAVGIMGSSTFPPLSAGRMVKREPVHGVRAVPAWPVGVEDGVRARYAESGMCYTSVVKREEVEVVAGTLGKFPTVDSILRLDAKVIDFVLGSSVTVARQSPGVVHVSRAPGEAFLPALAVVARQGGYSSGSLGSRLAEWVNLETDVKLRRDDQCGALLDDVGYLKVEPVAVRGYLSGAYRTLLLRCGGFDFVFEKGVSGWSASSGEVESEPLSGDDIVLLLLFLGVSCVFVRGLYGFASDAVRFSYSAYRRFMDWREMVSAEEKERLLAGDGAVV